MPGGYMGRILEVNLSTGEIKIEEPDEKLLRDYIGGYGIGARILYSRMKPGVDPLGPDNILGFATGPLTGTAALFGNRYTVFCKSPLTGGWGDANSGGEFGPGLKFAGFDAVLVTGVSAKPVYLLLDNGTASLKDASHLWGRDSHETEDILREEVRSKKAQIACIGPSGESRSLIACVMNNKGRAAGRSGVGAVMGSKNLKAIVAKGNMTVPVVDGEGLSTLRQGALKELGGGFFPILKKWGTAGITANSARTGDAPIKNWGGVGVVDFPNADAVGGDATIAHQAKRYGCWRCPTACGGIMKEIDGDYKLEAGVHKPEYETLASFGTNCLNENLESIIAANDICNRYGLDTISAGAAISFAIECYENGLIDKRDTDGIELTWGNHRAIIAMLQKLAKREGFGAVLADGVKLAAEKVGKNAADYAMHAGGQEMGMHDPRLAKSYFTAFKYDATPGRHTQGGVNEHFLNAAGLCMFGGLVGNSKFMVQYMNLVTGWNLTDADLTQIDDRLHNIRVAFNIREGINPAEVHVPPRVLGYPPLTAGPTAGRSIDMEKMTAAYVAQKGWDPATLKPTKDKLLELGLDDVAEDLWS